MERDGWEGFQWDVAGLQETVSHPWDNLSEVLILKWLLQSRVCSSEEMWGHSWVRGLASYGKVVDPVQAESPTGNVLLTWAPSTGRGQK